METVTISPKCQVVIPSRLRKRLGVKPRQKVTVMLYDDRIEMIPVRASARSPRLLEGHRHCGRSGIWGTLFKQLL